MDLDLRVEPDAERGEDEHHLAAGRIKSARFRRRLPLSDRIALRPRLELGQVPNRAGDLVDNPVFSDLYPSD